MIKNKTMKRFCVGTLAAVSALSFTAALTLNANVHGSALVSEATDMFVNASGVTVTANKSVPDTFLDYAGKTVQRDFDLGKSGVLLSASAVDSSVELSPTFAGNFEMTFRPYSSVSFHDDDWNGNGVADDYNRSDVAISQYADLREIAFDFVAEDGTAFTVAIAAGEKYNVITPAARVELGGVAIGYHYADDSPIASETGLKNSGGYYTRIGGTTFCNVARRGGEASSANSMPITFGYDSAAMQVYVEHYGTANSTQQHRVVLDLDDASNGLFAIDEFENYKVKMRFTDIKSGAKGNLVVYDINGQSLAGATFTDNVGAETIVKAEYNAIKGQNYTLPTPKAFDLLEGNIAYNGSVSVKRGGTSYDVYDKNGEKTTAWSEGCYFLPDSVGDYEISYTALDGKQNAGETETVTVSAFQSASQTTFTMDGNYKNITEAGTLGKGSVLTVYPASVTSEILASGSAEYAEVTLLKDNVVYGGLSQTLLKEATDVTLADAGSYRLRYGVPGLSDTAYEEYVFTVADTAPVYTFDRIPTVEAVGGTFELPTLWAKLGEENKRGAALLYAPDGSEVTVTGGKAVLEQVGEYKLTYLVRLGGVTYEYSVYFNAYNSNENAFTSDSVSVAATQGDSGDLYPSAAKGVKLTYTSTDVWAEYSRVIDLSKNTAADPLIKIMVLPSQVGKLDFWQYTIRLTDIYDAKKYVDVTVFKGSWGNQFSYVRAGGTDQPPAGWEMDKVLTAYNTGCPINYSFTGESLLGTETMNLYFDYQDLALYVDNIKRAGYSYGNQIIDLDSVECFSESMLFGGFTTGEVKLSISVQYLQAEAASILVTEVNGVSMAEKCVFDTQAPKISIDQQGYETIPQGLVNAKYPIFAGDAFDSVDGKLSVSTEVYLHYQTIQQTKLPVTNGTFTPTQSGTYSIVYRATDKSGNTSEKVLDVQVATSLPAFSYEFAETLVTEYSVGEKFVLPIGTAKGGSGNVTALVYLFDPDENEVSMDGLVFTEAGDYTLLVLLEDYLGRKHTITNIINVTISDSPVLYAVSLPSVMLNGSKYHLPAVQAVDYSTGSLVQPTTYIEVAYNGSTTKLTDTTYQPAISQSQAEVTIYYVAKNAAGKETRLSYPVTVLNTSNGNGGIDKTRYFKQSNITSATATDSYIEFVTNKEGASLSFANPLIANNLSLEFYIPKAKNNFEAVKITYTDVENSAIALSVYVKKNATEGETSRFNCGGADYEILGNFYDKTRTGFVLSYNNKSLYFVDLSKGVTMDKARVDDSGKPFAGFPSGRVYVTYTFEGVTGTSALRVQAIGNQGFDNATVDRVAPQFQLLSDLPTTVDIGVPVTVPAAIAADVLNPEVEVTLTIKLGSETFYTGAIDKAYQYTPTKYGEYQFIYTVKAGGRSSSTTYMVRVKDKIDPVLELLADVPTSAEVGKAVTLPQVQATDNEATDIRIWIFVTEADGKMYALDKDTYTVTFDKAGKHMITYYIEDNYGNYVYQKNFIVVK